MDEYKQGEEWTALNAIWRSISKEQREANYDNFKIVTEFIKASYLNKNSLVEEKSEETCVDDYRYLDKVSESAKNLVIDLVNKGEKNIYHSIMSIIGVNRGKFKSEDQLWEYYSKRFGRERPYIYTHEDEIKEIISLCLIRMDLKGINPL